MSKRLVLMQKAKKVALVAHDNQFCATGTAGTLLEDELEIKVTKLRSGPLGRDQQLEQRLLMGRLIS
jgi:methylglyoxal synthase